MIFKSDIDVECIQQMGSDNIIASAAWVSTTAEEGLTRAKLKPDDVTGVINYLLKHRHGTPFEHGAITFSVKAPIFVWREWHRHRVGFSYNEESGRYKVLSPCFFLPDRQRPMIKVDNWKPGRPKFLTLDEYFEGNLDLADRYYSEIIRDMQEGYTQEYDRYLRQLDRKLDPGLARDNLPVGIYSSCWVTCNPRSLMHFLSLRTHEEMANHVSYPLHEIELAARLVENHLASYWPQVYSAFVANGREGP